jgi:hypothetical protein
MAISISTSDDTFLYINTAHVSALVSWLRFQLEVFILRQWRHVGYVPKSSITFPGIFSVYNRVYCMSLGIFVIVFSVESKHDVQE